MFLYVYCTRMGSIAYKFVLCWCTYSYILLSYAHINSTNNTDTVPWSCIYTYAHAKYCFYTYACTHYTCTHTYAHTHTQTHAHTCTNIPLFTRWTYRFYMGYLLFPANEVGRGILKWHCLSVRLSVRMSAPISQVSSHWNLVCIHIYIRECGTPNFVKNHLSIVELAALWWLNWMEYL